MELNMSIGYEVKDTTPEVEAAREEIVAEETRWSCRGDPATARLRRHHRHPHDLAETP